MGYGSSNAFIKKYNHLCNNPSFFPSISRITFPYSHNLIILWTNIFFQLLSIALIHTWNSYSRSDNAHKIINCWIIFVCSCTQQSPDSFPRFVVHVSILEYLDHHLVFNLRSLGEQRSTELMIMFAWLKYNQFGKGLTIYAGGVWAFSLISIQLQTNLHSPLQLISIQNLLRTSKV